MLIFFSKCLSLNLVVFPLQVYFQTFLITKSWDIHDIWLKSLQLFWNTCAQTVYCNMTLRMKTLNQSFWAHDSLVMCLHTFLWYNLLLIKLVQWANLNFYFASLSILKEFTHLCNVKVEPPGFQREWHYDKTMPDI